MNKKIFSVVFVLFYFISGYSQVYEPVKWKFNTNILNDSTAELLFEATIDEGWYIYSQYIQEGGPFPTIFYFNKLENCSLIGNVIEQNAKTEYFPVFEMELKSFSEKTIFKQQIKIINNNFKINGELEFMTCNDIMCLPPEYIDFTFNNNDQVIPNTQEITPSAINSYIIDYLKSIILF